jgi:MarR family transcriptional regulator, organic hydroperoxide resistance regulator
MYFSSNTLARKIEKLAQESWKPAGLSPSHAYLLILVLEMPGVQPTTLTGHLQLTPSTITRLIEKLEEQKLVTRNYEGKTTFVMPTTRAKQMQPLLLQCQKHFYNSYSTVLGKEASAKLVDAINTVADKL